MANLSGSLSQIGNIVLLTEAATAYQQMATAYGKNLLAECGYMSEWDLYKEYGDCFAPLTGAYPSEEEIARETDTFNATIKGLIAKPDPTEADRTTLKDFFKDKGYGWFDYSKQQTAPGSENLKWFAFQKYKTSWTHPVLQDGTEFYAAPNTINKDPRRTGRYVLIAGQDTNQLTWLYQNSYKYGFIWYGPQDGAFFYVGMDKKVSATAEKALALGMDANMYRLVENKTGKAPQTHQDVESYLNTLLPTLVLPNGTPDENERGKYKWTYWAVVMNQIQT